MQATMKMMRHVTRGCVLFTDRPLLPWPGPVRPARPHLRDKGRLSSKHVAPRKRVSNPDLHAETIVATSIVVSSNIMISRLKVISSVVLGVPKTTLLSFFYVSCNRKL